MPKVRGTGSEDLLETMWAAVRVEWLKVEVGLSHIQAVGRREEVFW